MNDRIKLDYDVIVVGAGPSGSSVAHTLAKNGFRVCLVDKQTFPRHKLCGGLLTLRSKKIFDEIFSTAWDSIIYMVKHLTGIKLH